MKLREIWSKMMSKLPARMSHNDVEVAVHGLGVDVGRALAEVGEVCVIG